MTVVKVVTVLSCAALELPSDVDTAPDLGAEDPNPGSLAGSRRPSMLPVPTLGDCTWNLCTGYVQSPGNETILTKVCPQRN